MMDRRNFVQTFITGVAGMAVIPVDLARPAVKGGRIGFVDYKLDNFHANTFLKAFRNELKNEGFEVTGAFALEEKEGRVWAEKNGVKYFQDISDLNEIVDYYLILSPSNTEYHLQLANLVFPYGKATYVDKTFAPDLITAKQIFDLADKHSVFMQSSSALRYTNVQSYVNEIGSSNVLHMVAWGGGSKFDEYAIHPLELVISCMGPEIESVMRRGVGDLSQILLNFSNDRTAVVNVYTHTETPFTASVTTSGNTRFLTVDDGKLFIDAAKGILDFYNAGKPLIDRKETLAIMAIIDVARNPDSLKGFVSL